MKKFIVIASVLVSCSFTQCSKPLSLTDKEGSFTVLTYNVAGLPEGISGSRPAALTPLISPLLNDYDIVNVQEDFNYHHLLIKDVRHPYKSNFMAPVPHGDGLNLFSNFPFTDFTRKKWDACFGTDCLTPKGFTYCRIELDYEVYIDLYNVHCNAGSGEADLAARRNNIIQLCKFIDRHSAGNAALIMGDMNCRYTRTRDTIREVLNRGFKDVWIELIRDGIVPTQDGNSLSDCSINSTNTDCEVVDKIYYRSNDKIELIPLEFDIQREKFSLPSGEWLSDHMPIYTKFRYVLKK
jgi:endonuclease/exonuclease/phosphatase family metal-dependent hydrolase